MREFDLLYWVRLGWLTGPIFDKELRVSSRRRRNYVIRSAYVIVLAVMMGFMWAQMARYRNQSAYQTREIAEMGRVIVLLVAWSQFLLCQIVAGVMLSTAISDEVYNKTLGVLMTTPISGLQIVTGKLLSKLLQCVLLVGVSLPALAMVRVFGGVPWGFVLSTVCITLCMSLCVGAISLFFSISQRRAYVVIIQTIMTLGVLFALLPLLIFWSLDQFFGIKEQPWLPTLFLIFNPYGMMAMATEWLMSPRSISMSIMKYWPAHCGIMLTASSCLLFWCTVRVRKVALRQIAGDTGVVKKKKRAAKPVKQTRRPWLLRHMGNWPLLWKDLRTPVFGSKTRFRKILWRCLFLGAFVLLYSIIGIEGGFDEEEMHAVMSVIYGLIAMLLTIVITATCITSEKESRNWPILLGTAQTDWQILVSKWLAMLRWSLPAWGFLFGHLLVFSLLGYRVHPSVLFLLFPVCLGVINLMLGTGLFWSARMRRTTTAVVCNFIVPLLLWAIIPLLWVIIIETSRMSDNALEAYINWNPVFQLGNIVEGCTKNRSPLRFYFTGGQRGLDYTLWLVIKGCFVNSLIGLVFAWRAKHLFRRRIF